MAVLSFGAAESDRIFLRNAILRMIVTRAKVYLTHPADIEQLDFAVLVGALMFEHMTSDERVRLSDAAYQATQVLRNQVAAGEPTEEPVRTGIDEKLGEILAFLSCYSQ